MIYNLDEDNAELATPLLTPSSFIPTNISSTYGDSSSVSIINYDGEKTKQSSTNHNLNASTSQSNLNDSVYEQISKILAYVKRIEGKLESIEVLLSSRGHKGNTTVVDNINMNEIPMKTVFDVEEMERKFTTDENFLNEMVILIFFWHYYLFHLMDKS